MVKYIPSQKNRINLSIRFSFNIPDHQGASDELHTLNKCLRGRCYFPSPHGIKILWLEAPDKPDSVLWKAGRETVSNCSLMNELIMKLSLTADIPMGLKGPLCWWTNFPSLTSTKINNRILGKNGLPGRHNVFGCSQLLGTLEQRGKACGHPGWLIWRVPVRGDKNHVWFLLTCTLWGLSACFKCTYLVSWPNQTHIKEVINHSWLRNVALPKIRELFHSSCVSSAT